MSANEKSLKTIGYCMSVLLGILFVLSGVMKLIGGEQLAKNFEKLGLPITMATPLGILEIICVAVFLYPPTAVIGAILLTGYMGGAICTHWRVGDPFAFQMVFGIAVWAALYFRDIRFRKLIRPGTFDPPM